MYIIVFQGQLRDNFSLLALFPFYTDMKSIKLFAFVVGMMMSVVGMLICLVIVFPGYAMEFGMTDEGLKSLLIIFVMWMFLFAVSMHVYAEETRRH